MREEVFLDIVSSRRASLTAGLARAALQALSWPYAAAVELRNLAYARRLARTHRVAAPVVSIGNITTGGVGKTPTVAWLANQLRESGRRPVIISRGYRSLDGEENDEKRLLDRLCAGVPHLQNRDRAAAARQALREGAADVVLLDDGFQHRRLERDFDLVVIDALVPWGYGHVLPRGLLREPLKNLQRADAVLISRCDLATEAEVADIVRQLKERTAAPLFRTAFRPTGLINVRNERLSLGKAASRRAVAFCGIGNPAGFRRTLASVAIPVDDDRFLAFPDHHHYDNDDLRKIALRAEEQGAELLLTTGKDLVKMTSARLGGASLWALEIELTFLDDAAPLLSQLQAAIESPPRR